MQSAEDWAAKNTPCPLHSTRKGRVLIQGQVRARRIEGTWRQTRQPNKDQAIHGTESQSLWQVPSLDAKLMTKDQDLSSQRGPRLEQ